MHSRSLSLAGFAACFLPGILSMPLETTRSNPTWTAEHIQSDVVVKAAKDEVLHSPDNLKHDRPVIKAGFGTHRQLDPSALHYLVKRGMTGNKKTTPKLATIAKTTLTAGAKNPKLATTAKSLAGSTTGKKSAPIPGAKKSPLAATKPLSKLSTGPRKPSSKVAGSPKPMPKSPTGKRVASAKFGAAGAKKLSTGNKLIIGKPLTKGASRGGAKTIAGGRTAGSKPLIKGANRAGSKKVTGAQTPKPLTNGASREGFKKVAGTKSLTRATSKVGETRKSAAARAQMPSSRNNRAPKPTSEVVQPRIFSFSKDLNAAGKGGVLSTDVLAYAGAYRTCSINTATNHQPVLFSIAQHEPLDDCVYFTATGK